MDETIQVITMEIDLHIDQNTDNTTWFSKKVAVHKKKEKKRQFYL